MFLTRFCLLAAASAAMLCAQTKRPFKLDDLARFQDVRDPQCSPDGNWVAYVMSQTDVKQDRGGNSHIWLIGFDGKNERQITTSDSSEGSPRFSPDGKFIAFTSSRPGGAARGNQVWLLPREGGEAYQLTDTKGRLSGFEWSPDSTRLALVIGDPDPDAPDPDNPTPQAPAANAAGGRGRGGAGGAAPKPIVIDRYHYKQDVQGYLTGNRHSYIYIFDIATKKTERLTTQTKWDEGGPSWSPDGKFIAFSSNHVAEPDRDPGGQIYVAEAKPGTTEKMLTALDGHAGGGGRGGRPEWSPDGKWIAFLQGEEKKWGAYSQEHLAIVPSDGSHPASLVKAALDLDRGVGGLHWEPDGKSILVTVTDDMSIYPARIPINGGKAEQLHSKPVMISNASMTGTCGVFISGGDDKHNEIYASDHGTMRQLTHKNDAVMAEIEWGKTEEVSFKAKDGNEVHGLLTYPVGYQPGTKVPLLLRIHGGPKGQDAHALSFEAQWFAANGYAVLRMNYRGSDGRGSKYQKAIAADWGHLEVEDLEAGVDGVIKMGVADPDRLGVGGWSYGGILTDYMIASDTRFKAATSGAGTAFTVSFYGTDQYIIQYDNEIGPPWNPKAWETYVKISYPFLHADRIKTPTLFLGGERDFNVPVQGGQQMYQALRSLGIDTQLIIYPNEFHGIQRPSYVRDRYERYLAWYDKYLKKGSSAPATSPAR
jgi:dipeptidyl aminopeptidase/acylaminoacyl peptidase